MKKKLILILSMVALLVCVFAISVNADDFNSPFASEIVTVNLPTYYMTYDGSFDISPAMILNESYELITYFYLGGHTFHYNDGSNDFVQNSILQYPDSDGEIQEVYDMKLIKAYLESKDVVDFNSFNVWRKNIESCGPFDDFLISTVTEEIYEKMFIFKESSVITEEDLIAQYNQGKTDGVNEFKESDDYTGALLTEYTSGHADGYNAYKESNEYQSALETQYKLGSSTGVKNFIESEEYSNALKAEYDNGFEAATAEQEQEGAINILTTVLGISGALVLILLGVYFFMGKKGKKRR